jgi:2-polyprenyl-6-methoxyphenol hydroxylase-like FAD-dependent oxidoreductase
MGINLAMIDSLNLANAIAASCDGSNAAGGLGLEKAIMDYEQGMLDRAEQFADRTWKGLENHFSAGGGEAFVHRVLTRGK